MAVRSYSSPSLLDKIKSMKRRQRNSRSPRLSPIKKSKSPTRTNTFSSPKKSPTRRKVSSSPKKSPRRKIKKSKSPLAVLGARGKRSVSPHGRELESLTILLVPKKQSTCPYKNN